MIRFSSSLIASLLVVHCSTVMGQDTAFSCTEVEGDMIFPPLEVDCPPNGERLVVSFKWKYPGNDPNEGAGVQRTIAATHGGGLTEGIAVGPDSFSGSCTDFFLADSPDDIFFKADFTEFCSAGLSTNSLCQGVSMNDSQTSIEDDAIVVFNTGGCQDKIKLEVSLSGIFGGPGECVAPLTLECEGETSVNSSGADSGADIGADTDSGTDVVSGTTTHNADGTCNDEELGSCVLAGFFTDDLNLYSDCGFFTKKVEENWCYDSDLQENICCGDGSGHCCKANGGVIAGISIALLVALVAAIFGCCYCCGCCCLNDRLRGRNNNIDSNNTGNVEQALPSEPKADEN